MEEILCKLPETPYYQKFITTTNLISYLWMKSKEDLLHLRSWEEDTNIKDYHLFLRLNQNFFKEQ